MAEEEVPRVAAKHDCGGPSCAFCEWSNPTLDLDASEAI
jgi:hypothetical protein